MLSRPRALGVRKTTKGTSPLVPKSWLGHSSEAEEYWLDMGPKDRVCWTKGANAGSPEVKLKMGQERE